MPDESHRYETRLRWSGSTGVGWDDYDRAHSALAPPAEQEVRLTTGESMGDPAILNPEQLVVMAASSCQMLWFLHLAAKARIDVVEYEDEATATMPVGDRLAGLAEITLRPRIVLASDAADEHVHGLAEKAHHYCNIANSLRCPVSVVPRVERREEAA